MGFNLRNVLVSQNVTGTDASFLCGLSVVEPAAFPQNGGATADISLSAG
jgi:hypothetical protein